MKNWQRTSTLLAVAALLAASCSKIAPITAPARTSGRANFSVIAALGSAVTAGFQSNGLVDRHQIHTYVSIFAQQAGAHTLDLPLIGGDGIPPLLGIQHLYPPPVQIAPISANPGNPTNLALASAYHNMGIPGGRVQDVIDSTNYGRNAYFGIIQRGRGTLAQQIATHLNPPPTFVLFEFGFNEVLAPALNGTTLGLTSVASFADTLERALDTLATLLPNAKLAVFNVPDVTKLPFFTTVSNRQLDAAGNPVVDVNGKPQFLLGPNFDAAGHPLPLTAGDQVLLTARSQIALGYGYPIGTFSYLSGAPVPGNGIGLTDAQVLSTTEAATIADRAQKFNVVIDTTVNSTHVPRDIALFDFGGFLNTARSPGFEIQRVVYTTRFLTGGLISLDGVHPNDLCHALLCNQLISAVNARFGSTIQPVNPLQYATLSSSSAEIPKAETGSP